MPLFNYKCLKCALVVEKFQHKPKKINIECKKCGNTKFDKVIGKIYSKIWLNAKDTYNQIISPEVDRIQKKISEGSDKDFLDIAGD